MAQFPTSAGCQLRFGTHELPGWILLPDQSPNLITAPWRVLRIFESPSIEFREIPISSCIASVPEWAPNIGEASACCWDPEIESYSGAQLLLELGCCPDFFFPSTLQL